MSLNDENKYKVEVLINDKEYVRCSPENLEYDDALKIVNELHNTLKKKDPKIHRWRLQELYRIANMRGDLHELLIYEEDLKEIYKALAFSGSKNTELLEQIGAFIGMN